MKEWSKGSKATEDTEEKKKTTEGKAAQESERALRRRV